MTKAQRDRLAAIKERTNTVRDERAKARQAVATAEKLRDTEAAGLANAKLDATEADLEYLMELENVALSQVAVGNSGRFGAPLRNNLESQGVLREIAGSSADLRGNVSLGPIMGMEDTLGLFGQAINAAPVSLPDNTGRGPVFAGIAPTPTPANTLLDLFASRPFESRTLDFLRRTGNVTNAAAVAEGALKPEAAIQYTPETAEAEVFAAWSKYPRQAADDVEGLLADLQLTLGTGVLTALEGVLVNGSVPFGIDGIKSTTGVAAPSLVGVTNLADAAALLLRDLRMTGVDPNFIAVHPSVYTQEAIRKDAQGGYISAIVDGRLWEVPVVQSIALDANDVIAGDSRIAGYVAVRQPVHALVGTDSDDLVRNMLTCLVELRATPVITVPAALAIGNLPAA